MVVVSNPLPRSKFIGLALLVQGGVILLAFLVAWTLNLPVNSCVRWNLAAALWGLLAVPPMLLIYFVSPGLRKLAMESLGNSLRQLRWWELVVLAALAGVGEELLFRGVLYEGLARWHVGAAIVLSNVAFGMLHALSLNYFLTTTGIGLAMHFLAEATGTRNLLAPMLAHGVYDLIAFILLIREGQPTSESDQA
jgi:membrane protease YdiL (CAAX protease family)